METIESLKNKFKLYKDINGNNHSKIVERYNYLSKICNVLLNDFSDQLRKEPFYSFSLDIIDEIMNFHIGISSNKFYDGSDMHSELVTKKIDLLKEVMPADEKMQRIITRVINKK